MASIYDSSKFVIGNKIIEAKEKGIIELHKTTLDNPRVNNVQAIPFNNNDETNATTFDKNNIENGTSFIDKMISETTEPELVAQLKKVKQNCVFNY
ncbi:MAG TPA: hypothetical protein VLA74_06950 [Nitrososphaeraceae archaeon]|nr:hypothetical protein [Nitrososphaeraceae archaeon]